MRHVAVPRNFLAGPPANGARFGAVASRLGPAPGRPAHFPREVLMRKRELYSSAAAVAFAALLAAMPTPLVAQTAVAIDNDDIGGVVTGPNGPEAGVWVIAETRDTPTRFARMVVTDDQGR